MAGAAHDEALYEWEEEFTADCMRSPHVLAEMYGMLCSDCHLYHRGDCP